MSLPLDVRERALGVWGGRITLRVKTAGRGAPLVYLHPASGLQFDPFLASLSTQYSIYAPEVPGTSAGDPHAIHEVDGLSDLVLIYEEAIRQLELPEPPVVIGQSFGGMLAAELASYFPRLFKKVVLCDPIGLWRPDLPIANWITTPASAAAGAAVQESRLPGGEGHVHAPAGSSAGRHRPFQSRVGARLHGQVRLADPRKRSPQAPASRDGADPDRVGRG